MIKGLFDTFPREVFRQRIFVTTQHQFVTLINRYNSVIDCYTTVYNIAEKRGYDTAVIDKLFFDIDPDENFDCWLETKAFHNRLLNMNLRHTVIFSGKGFHVYVWIKRRHFKYPRNMLRNAQLSLMDGNKMDTHVLGDLARISRVPNTWNMGGERLAIPLAEDDFLLTYEQIREKALKPQPIYIFDGQEYDTKKYDTENSVLNGFTKVNGVKQEVIRPEFGFGCFVKLLPPFVRGLLISGRDRWQDRYLQILAMREVGLPLQITLAITKQYWRQHRWEHALKEERQFEYVYGRGDLNFPNWDTLMNMGYVITEDDTKFSFYRSVYA